VICQYASSPEWYSEKAAAIACYAVASGIHTHLGHPPNLLGSPVVTNLALNGLKGLVGAVFHVEPDPLKAAEYFDQLVGYFRCKVHSCHQSPRIKITLQLWSITSGLQVESQLLMH